MPESSPLRIVLNYRRDDASGHAGRLYDDLSERFGDDRVFMDIDTIQPGTDFADVIDRAVGSCDVFLSIIGKRWLAATDSAGRRRLDSPEDYVRLEIEAALNRKVRVIPVLVQGAEMPTSDDLPASLAPLARIQALEVSDARWRYDIGRLVDRLVQLEREKAGVVRGGSSTTVVRPPLLTRGRAVVAGAALTAIAVVGVAVALLTGGGGGDDSVTATVGGTSKLGTLVYSRDGRIWTVRSDGAGDAAIGDGSAPDWSADGSKIAFARGEDIWVMNADGGDAARLTDGPPVDNAPAWSPDGQELLFDRTERGSTSIWEMNADGSDARRLTQGGAPDWSPAGNRIVFQRKREIWVMNADGGGERDLTSDMDGAQLSATWSPEGTKIAFAWFSPDEGTQDIYVMNTDGTDKVNLTHGTVTRGNYPTWSPDGKKLAITAPDGLWIVNRDGSGLHRILSGGRFESPAWAAAKA